MDRNEAIDLAIESARQHPESYTTVMDFQPHEWVIRAIMDASKSAYDEGYDEGLRSWV